MQDQAAPEGSDPHDEILRLEAHIEELASRLENCRKFNLAARIAMAGGAIVLAATLIGAIRFDPRVLLGAMTALLGGIVLWGSNSSTAKEAADQLANAEAERAALIEQIHLRVVGGGETLH
jgi:hypothetical protein